LFSQLKQSRESQKLSLKGLLNAAAAYFLDLGRPMLFGWSLSVRVILYRPG